MDLYETAATARRRPAGQVVVDSVVRPTAEGEKTAAHWQNLTLAKFNISPIIFHGKKRAENRSCLSDFGNILELPVLCDTQAGVLVVLHRQGSRILASR